MKNFIIFASFLMMTFANAQVAIGKNNVTNSSVSLEFGNYAAPHGKGIIVPWVNSSGSTSSSEKGTIVFDTNDKIVKYKKADGTWFNLTRNEILTVEGTPNFDTTGVVDTTLQNSLNDAASAKTSIGIPPSGTDTPGILVLEDTNKSMILPKVASPHLNIINPEPGTLVYDTDSKQLAVFNGKVWTFWKP